MPAEELPRHYELEDTTEEYSFDELAKGLADGTLSRGRALKVLAGALLGGGLLAIILPDSAGAVEQRVGGGGGGGNGGGNRRRRRRRRGGGNGGGTVPTCDPATCEGCCDPSGVCVPFGQPCPGGGTCVIDPNTNPPSPVCLIE